MAERPLDDRELRILRGMLDEYQSGELRRRFFHSMFSRTWKVIVAVLAVTVAALQIASAFKVLLGG